MVKLTKLKDRWEIEAFQKEFNSILGYSTVPLEYLESGDCFVLLVNHKLVAGFCLVSGFDNLRSIQQLPENVREDCKTKYPYIVDNLADFTGYFINTKSKLYGILFTIYLVLVCATYPKKYFIYSYLISETRLGKYYSSGSPLKIHTGKPEHLNGHHDTMEEEHVEVLSKIGIFKIFLYRTKRLIIKMLNFKR